MKEFVISEAKTETAVLVGLITKEQDEARTKEYLDELEFLATTAGARTVKRFTQRVGGPALSEFAPVEHPVPLESLQDVFDGDEVRERTGGIGTRWLQFPGETRAAYAQRVRKEREAHNSNSGMWDARLCEEQGALEYGKLEYYGEVK